MERKGSIMIIAVILSCLGIARFAGAWPIPDTGQTVCYNNETDIPCPKPGEPFYGQDGNYNINPKSYTKLGEGGAALPDSDSSWIMIRDNVTGLIWEKKTYDYSIHNGRDQYKWQDTQNAFIGSLNVSRFGGFSDWRMPEIEEIFSVVDRGGAYPVMDIFYFSNIVPDDYWSATTAAFNSSHAWSSHFFDGFDYVYSKSNSYYVVAVRGERNNTTDHLIINGDGTVTDILTGLMWEQQAASDKNWEGALSYCEGLSLAGYDDWRLPSMNELKSIVDYKKTNPSIDKMAFSDAVGNTYWSATSHWVYTDSAWLVSFDYGNGKYANKSDRYYARALRGGQNRLSGHLIIIAPAMGDVWDKGAQQTIKWETAGIGGALKISLSRQGGKEGTFETVAESAENDGVYEWQVSGEPSNHCMLKLEPVSDASKGAVQGLFTIQPPPPPEMNENAGCDSDSGCFVRTITAER